MKLESFQVKNFRSITHSGLIDVSRITAILGRNESGKSNLLLALKSLNPVGGITTYGGRNTPARIAQDAADLEVATVRDRALFEEAMKNR